MSAEDGSCWSGNPRQIRRERSVFRAANKAVNTAIEQAVSGYYEILGRISVRNPVEGVEVEQHPGGIKIVELSLSRGEVELAPPEIQKILRDLGIDRRDNPSVAACLSKDPASRLDMFGVSVLPQKVAGVKFGIAMALGSVEVITSTQMEGAVNSWHAEVEQDYQELWQKPDNKIAIFRAGNIWLGNIMAQRRHLIATKKVRMPEEGNKLKNFFNGV